MGSAVDTLVFEPELWDSLYKIAPEVNRRTKAGREEWAKLVAFCKQKNITLISNSQHSEALQTAKAIRENPVMADILRSGSSQDTYIWRDPVTGLLCKCRTDWYDEKTKTITDLKTAIDASPEGFSKAIANFGYHIQAAFYSDGVRACGKPVEKFQFAVMEKTSKDAIVDPKLMAFYELSIEDIQAGQDTYTSGLAAINFCMIHDEWEGYSDNVLQISRPAWARKSDVEMVSSL